MLRAAIALAVIGWAAHAAAEPEKAPAQDPQDTAVPAQGSAAPLSKKARGLEAKKQAQGRDAATGQAVKARWQRQLDRRIGKPPAAIINIYNTWTHETMVLDAQPPPAARSQRAPRAATAALPEVPQPLLDRFFRCHFTNEPTSMDRRLFAALVAAARHFGAPRIEIISGFRSPKYNLILRKKGREVSRRSQHTVGHAIDFRLPGVGVKRLHEWAKSLRLGGVGYYPKSGFIHIDTGRIRQWQGR